MGSVFERGTDGPKVIVVAVDGSVTSLRAASYAAGLARRQSAELVVVFVATGSPMANFVPAAGVAVDEALHDVAAQLRKQVEIGAADQGIRARFIEAKGDPYAEISRICQKVMADAVVVGASTSSGHRLIGSVGVRLVRAGLWPVTVVP
ncbi:Nucleotide-binding universal stress protein, UspA family [Nakamurella panacisegetis]|uniref:Nucleotide-binding universal stress protein, UspA family n=1 Tax=Nakamurella panacisegetis TaxID=1090615 RepID=A0A1H0N404_9ACTN|nr:universal stress protein [Nakamurella panacisegetis]SDO87407.1 Nucleotide-binding universal stress protein, UspA family [Nakamurella panacisegetis]